MAVDIEIRFANSIQQFAPAECHQKTTSETADYMPLFLSGDGVNGKVITTPDEESRSFELVETILEGYPRLASQKIHPF
jgi:hypothetical protein